MVGITAVITLAPFRFALPGAVRLSWKLDPEDIAANVLLFLPLGFLYRLAASPAAPRSPVAIWVGAAAASALLESVQIFLPGRYPSLVDVLTNSLGAMAGATLHERIERWLDQRLVHQLALELPLMNVVYLLVPLLWLDGLAAGREAGRLWLLPLLGLFGAAVLHGIWQHRLRGTGRLSANGVAVVAAAWFVVASFPGLSGALPFMLGCSLFLGALVRAQASLPSRAIVGERRFELPTLRRAAPVYAGYLALSALWPWPWTPVPWHASLGLGDVADLPGVVPVLRLLEHLAAFTLLGYLVAEGRGRHDESLPRMGAWVVAASLASGGALELLRGLHPGHVASLLRLGLVAAAGLYGGLTYRLQIVLVRRLVAAAPDPRFHAG
jgi:hypothetical protein